MVDEAAKTNGRLPISPDLQFMMDLHRDVLRGAGFWKTLKRGIVNGDQPQPPRRLPVVNLISIPQKYLAALFEEILEEDRHRFMKYFSHLLLGLGLIKARRSLIPSSFTATTY